jgi:hypothetical protein
MAVTIDEMHVDVTETPARPAPGAGAGAGAEPKKDMNLSQALELLRERTLRLKAD